MVQFQQYTTFRDGAVTGGDEDESFLADPEEQKQQVT